MLTVGSPAPSFHYQTAAGETKSTDGLRGTPYIVYFYPRDDTPGCTKEACGFRDQAEAFGTKGIEVIGVSGDSEASHAKFRTKYALPFALASDPDHTITKAFGAWGKKKFMGREYEGIHRITFIVDKDGKIAHVYQQVKPETHAETILQDLNQIL